MSGEVLHNAAGEMTVEALPVEEDARAALEAARSELEMLRSEVERFRAGGIPILLALQLAALEHRFRILPVPEGPNGELGGEGIYGFQAYAVEADRELERLIVVLGAGIDDGDAFDHLAEGDSPAEIAHRYAVAFQGYLNPRAMLHRELIDGVVDDLLQQDIYAIIGMRAIAQPPYIHSGPQPYMFKR